MKKFSVLIILNLYFNLLMAQEESESKAKTKPFDCVSKLMSQPTCINRLNSTNACKLFGGSPEAVTMIQKCIEKKANNGAIGTMAPPNIIALCLAGFSSSNKVSDNETNCKLEDVEKSKVVNDDPKGKFKDLPSENDKAEGTTFTNSAVSK